MASSYRARLLRFFVPLVLLFFFRAVSAPAAGFQVFAQGAKATGMGLAFTAVADDPSAIFYNPAGLGWQKHYSAMAGASLLTRTEGELEGGNPFPGRGVRDELHQTTYVIPNVYAVVPLTESVNFGLGIYAPFGLGFRWENAERFSGRFISQNAVLQSSDINPVLSWQTTPSFSIAVGADYRLSRLTLEQNQGRSNPFTGAFVDVAHIKLDSELQDNGGWGWNAGILWRPLPGFSLGAAYRSSIEIDFEGAAKFTQRRTGNAAFDALVAAGLPQGEQKLETAIEFPSNANFGAAFTFAEGFTVALEADWTEWSLFESLKINFQNPAIPDLLRETRWEDSWAYRAGLEKKWGRFAIRAGYYFDESPQPLEDVGPVLVDADRNVYALGIGYHTQRWGVDLSDLYIDVQDRDTRGVETTDGFFARYAEAGNLLAISFRVSF